MSAVRDWRPIATAVFAIMIVAVAGLGFMYKMTEFAMTMVNDEVVGFGTVAIGTYLIGMLPIVFIMLWAVLTGRFRDIERPKFRVLELNDEIDRAEAARG